MRNETKFFGPALGGSVASSTRSGLWPALLLLLLGGLTGSAVSEAIRLLVPWPVIHKLLVTGPRIGISPPGRIDLGFLTVTFGFSLRLNLMTALGMFSGLLLSRKI